MTRHNYVSNVVLRWGKKANIHASLKVRFALACQLGKMFMPAEVSHAQLAGINMWQIKLSCNAR